MAGRQIERDDAQAFGVDSRLQLLPVLHRKTREAVYRLHQQDVPLARILQQAQQLRPICRGSAGVLQIYPFELADMKAHILIN